MIKNVTDLAQRFSSAVLEALDLSIEQMEYYLANQDKLKNDLETGIIFSMSNAMTYVDLDEEMHDAQLVREYFGNVENLRNYISSPENDTILFKSLGKNLSLDRFNILHIKSQDGIRVKKLSFANGSWEVSDSRYLASYKWPAGTRVFARSSAFK